MFKINRENSPTCRIAISLSAGKEERFAAEELAEAIGQMFGFRPSIIGEEKDLKNVIFVGETARMKERYGSVYQSLTGDENAVACDGDNVYCFGRSGIFTRAGNIYAVYTFLEKFFQVRYLAADETVYPEKRDIGFEKFEPQIDRPDFFIRWYLAAETRVDPVFAVRRRIKDAYVQNLPGGGVYPAVASGNFHNFYEYVPPSEYKEKHPDWFDDKSGQLCFSKEEIADVITKKLIAEIEENPDSVYFVVGQNDTPEPCGCEDCKRQYEKYLPSGALIRLINIIARKVRRWQEEHCPQREIRIVTFAYYFGQRPPVKETAEGFVPLDLSVVPEKNVYILFTTIDYCYYHKLEDSSCAWNKDFTFNFRGWRSLVGDRMLVWYYSANYAHYLYPFWDYGVLSANYRLFRESGIRFVIDHGPCEAVNMPFSQLQTYVHSALLWRADEDTNALLKEFISGYYKDCAEEVGRFFRLYTERLAKQDERTGYHLRLYHLPEEMFSRDLFDAEFLAEAEKILKRAYETALAAEGGNEAGKLCIRIGQLEASVKYLRYMNEVPTREEAEDFVRQCRRCGITKYKEYWANDDIMDELKEQMLNGKVLAY